jgi:uncharacterized membrane protein SirB2
MIRREYMQSKDASVAFHRVLGLSHHTVVGTLLFASGLGLLMLANMYLDAT